MANESFDYYPGNYGDSNESLRNSINELNSAIKQLSSSVLQNGMTAATMTMNGIGQTMGVVATSYGTIHSAVSPMLATSVSMSQGGRATLEPPSVMGSMLAGSGLIGAPKWGNPAWELANGLGLVNQSQFDAARRMGGGAYQEYNRYMLSQYAGSAVDTTIRGLSDWGYDAGMIGASMGGALAGVGIQGGIAGFLQSMAPWVAAPWLFKKGVDLVSGGHTMGDYGMLGPLAEASSQRQMERQIKNDIMGSNLFVAPDKKIGFSDAERYSSEIRKGIESASEMSGRWKFMGGLDWGKVASPEELTTAMEGAGLLRESISSRGEGRLTENLKNVRARVMDDAKAVVELSQQLNQTLNEAAQQLSSIKQATGYLPGVGKRDAVEAVREFGNIRRAAEISADVSSAQALEYGRMMQGMFSRSGRNYGGAGLVGGVERLTEAGAAFDRSPELYPTRGAAVQADVDVMTALTQAGVANRVDEKFFDMALGQYIKTHKESAFKGSSEEIVKNAKRWMTDNISSVVNTYQKGDERTQYEMNRVTDDAIVEISRRGSPGTPLFANLRPEFQEIINSGFASKTELYQNQMRYLNQESLKQLGRFNERDNPDVQRLGLYHMFPGMEADKRQIDTALNLLSGQALKDVERARDYSEFDNYRKSKEIPWFWPIKERGEAAAGLLTGAVEWSKEALDNAFYAESRNITDARKVFASTSYDTMTKANAQNMFFDINRSIEFKQQEGINRSMGWLGRPILSQPTQGLNAEGVAAAEAESDIQLSEFGKKHGLDTSNLRYISQNSLMAMNESFRRMGSDRTAESVAAATAPLGSTEVDSMLRTVISNKNVLSTALGESLEEKRNILNRTLLYDKQPESAEAFSQALAMAQENAGIHLFGKRAAQYAGMFGAEMRALSDSSAGEFDSKYALRELNLRYSPEENERKIAASFFIDALKADGTLFNTGARDKDQFAKAISLFETAAETGTFSASKFLEDATKAGLGDLAEAALSSVKMDRGGSTQDFSQMASIMQNFVQGMAPDKTPTAQGGPSDSAEDRTKKSGDILDKVQAVFNNIATRFGLST